MTSKKYKTSISEQEWRQLGRNDAIVDANDRDWLITRGAEESKPNCVWAQCPGYPEEELTWVDGQILEVEEWAVLVELNDPEFPAKLRKAA